LLVIIFAVFLFVDLVLLWCCCGVVVGDVVLVVVVLFYNYILTKKKKKNRRSSSLPVGCIEKIIIVIYTVVFGQIFNLFTFDSVSKKIF